MTKHVKIILIFIFLTYSNLSQAIESNKLINLEDINIIFQTDLKSWNQNLILLNKKKSMEKIEDVANPAYLLKTYFNDGYVIISPLFKEYNVYSLEINYNFLNSDKDLKIITSHFNNFKSIYCNSIKVKKNDIIINLKKC